MEILHAIYTYNNLRDLNKYFSIYLSTTIIDLTSIKHLLTIQLTFYFFEGYL
jgi:hypothetical protein